MLLCLFTNVAHLLQPLNATYDVPSKKAWRQYCKNGKMKSEKKAYSSQPNKVIKHSQRIRQQKPTNCLRVFDHFVGLVLKELNGLKSSLWEKSYFVGLALKGLKSLVTKLSYGKGTARKYRMVPFNPYEVWLQTSNSGLLWVVCYNLGKPLILL